MEGGRKEKEVLIKRAGYSISREYEKLSIKECNAGYTHFYYRETYCLLTSYGNSRYNATEKRETAGMPKRRNVSILIWWIEDFFTVAWPSQVIRISHSRLVYSWNMVMVKRAS